MTPTPILRITDGTPAGTIDFLSRGYGLHLRSWIPAVAEPKGGGVFVSSPLLDGRRLVQRVYDNTPEAFTLALNAPSQNEAVWYMQELRRLLTKAHQYWATEWQNQPVWIEARAAYETNIRYATIVDWRIPRDANPFSQPFFSSHAPVMDEVELAIERDHWQDHPPSQFDCMAISSVDEASLSISSSGATDIAASADDATVSYPGGTINLTSTIITIGGNTSAWYDGLFRFTNLNVPAGATIVSAYIRFKSAYSVAGGIVVNIYGERNATPATFSTYANYIARALTANYVSWITDGSWAQSKYYNSPDLSTIIQEIIDLPGWAANNEIALFVKGSKLGTSTRGARSYNYLPADAAELYVVYQTENDPMGQEETCVPDVVYLTNKSNLAQIDTIFMFENGVGYTNLLTANLPYSLLPISAAAGDYLYIGVDSTTAYGGPFNSVVFDLGLALVGATGQWQYSNSAGPTWATLTTLQDNTNGLATEGVNSLHFTSPTDWTAAAVNGVTAYWIRLNITAGVATQRPQQQNRHPYTLVHPYFDIAADQAAGDLPALIQLVLQNRSYSSATGTYVGGIHIGTRSLSRGEQFSAYFNASDEQHQPGVSEAVGGVTSLAADITAPTGRRAVYNPVAQNTTPVTQITWQIVHPYSAQYRGRYRAFLRYGQSGGADGDFTVRLGYQVQSANTRYTELIPVPKPDAATTDAILELGQVVFPGVLNEDIGTLTMYLQFVSLAAAGWGDVYIYDLILLPYDEWTGSFTGYSAIYVNEALKIDALSVPKDKTLAIEIDKENNNRILSIWNAVENNIPSLSPNQDTRVWVLMDRGNLGDVAYTKTDFVASVSMVASKVQRYLSMRGSR